MHGSSVPAQLAAACSQPFPPIPRATHSMQSELQELAEAPALRGAARQLAAVVEPAHSSVFDSILY